MITSRQDKVNATIAKVLARLEKLQSMTPEQIAKKYKEQWLYEVALDTAKEQLENNKNKLEEAKRLDAKEEERNDKKTALNAAKEIAMSKLPAEIEDWFEQVKHTCIVATIEARNFERSKNRFQTKNYALASMSDEEIEQDVERKVENMKLNLLDRVSEKCGEIKGCRNVRVENGNINEGTAINGTFFGTKGTATVKSITAGGYNIQRFHVRVLVK